MEIRIRLPGLSLESDRALAPLLAAVAVEAAHQTLLAASPPANAANACATDPDCRFLQWIRDGDETWAVYLCKDTIVAYPA